MDYQMKYDHQWLCTIVSVSLVVVRADEKVGFTLFFLLQLSSSEINC